MPAATIRIFLVDGTPLGIRVVDKSTGTGRGTEFSRADWGRARIREDFSKPGVYVLWGPADNGGVRVYIGEADELRGRINQHFSGPNAKDFWTRAIAFTTKDENLNKAHVRYLEARLVGMALSAKRAIVENGNAPSSPALSEYDRADADSFLEEILLVLPLVGVDAFSEPSSSVQEASLTLRITARGADISGHDTAEGFVVHKGSRVPKDVVASLHGWAKAHRQQLVESGALVDSGDYYTLTQDYLFASPSTAASVMVGRSINGRTEWKDAIGRTLKQIQEASAG